jgi:hypothetical protein
LKGLKLVEGVEGVEEVEVNLKPLQLLQPLQLAEGLFNWLFLIEDVNKKCFKIKDIHNK